MELNGANPFGNKPNSLKLRGRNDKLLDKYTVIYPS